jgi:hypothetical protein
MTQPPFSGQGLAREASGTGRGPQPPWQLAGQPPANAYHAPAPYRPRPVSPEQQPEVAPASVSRRHAPPESRTGVLYSLIMLCTAAFVGLVWSSPQNVRWGADLLGAGMVLAAVARVTFPERSAGMLATRRRWTDAATLTVLGLGTLAIGLVLPPPS